LFSIPSLNEMLQFSESSHGWDAMTVGSRALLPLPVPSVVPCASHEPHAGCSRFGPSEPVEAALWGGEPPRTLGVSQGVVSSAQRSLPAAALVALGGTHASSSSGGQWPALYFQPSSVLCYEVPCSVNTFANSQQCSGAGELRCAIAHSGICCLPDA